MSTLKARGPGRPKKVTTSCTWCAESKMQLKFVLPTPAGQKQFCSENCIIEFRKAYNKGACLQCDNVIRENAPHEDFCSKFCLNEHLTKEQNGRSGPSSSSASSTKSQSPPAVADTNNGTGVTAVLPVTGTANNNNNVSVENLNDTIGSGSEDRMSPHTGRNSGGGGGGAGGGVFQLEQLNVFNWDDYLKVSRWFGGKMLCDVGNEN